MLCATGSHPPLSDAPIRQSNFRQDIHCKLVCRIANLSKDETKKFKNFISDDYRINMVLDNLPIGMAKIREENGVAVKMYERGIPVGYRDASGKIFVHNHMRFTILYHEDETANTARIVGFEAEPFSVRQTYEGNSLTPSTKLSGCPASGQGLASDTQAAEVEQDKDLLFTYDVEYRASDILWASRWDTYLLASDDQIHWFSIVNSLMIVLFLSGMVAMIMTRTLHRDIAAYNALETVEEAAEETGWKLVHGDVFRAPTRGTWLAVCVGTGTQLFGMAVVTILFALLGFLSPANRGGLMTAVLLLFALMGGLGGYSSARLYASFKGSQRRATTLRTALAFPGLVSAIFLGLDLLIWGQRSSGAAPLGTLAALALLWIGVSVPLCFAGAYLGYRSAPPEDPVRTNKIPRQVPAQPWYMHPVFAIGVGGILPFGAVFIELFFILSSMWLHQFYYLFGFLALVFTILCLTCAEIAVVLVYFQLCSEDYRWWWRAYATSGASAVYLFAYSFFYFYTKLDITKVLPMIMYCGYMTIFSLAFFAMTGAIGFHACLWFVRKIYAAVKID